MGKGMKMSSLENTKLRFIVNRNEIEVEPMAKETFDRSWDSENEYGDLDTDRDFFDYCTAVSAAISKFKGYPLFARHQSGNISFEAYDNSGSFVGHFTVYSDYIDIHSIDKANYGYLLKDIA